MNEKIIYMVRHGLTLSNKEKIYAGWSDEELSDEGIVQTKNLANRLEKLNISAIYTSPIKRALQTAQIFGEFLKVPVILDKSLKEMKLGQWEGLSEKEIATLYPKKWEMWNIKPVCLYLRGRESLISVQNRVLKVVNKIICKNRISLAVTHVALIRCLILFYKGLDLNLYRQIEVPNLAIFEFKYDGENWCVDGKFSKKPNFLFKI